MYLVGVSLDLKGQIQVDQTLVKNGIPVSSGNPYSKIEDKHIDKARQLFGLTEENDRLFTKC